MSWACPSFTNYEVAAQTCLLFLEHNSQILFIVLKFFVSLTRRWKKHPYCWNCFRWCGTLRSFTTLSRTFLSPGNRTMGSWMWLVLTTSLSESLGFESRRGHSLSPNLKHSS